MNYSLENNEVSFGGQVVITDWRKVKVASPENLQDKIKVSKDVESDVSMPKQATPTSTSLVR